MAKHHGAAIWFVLVAGGACGKASTPMDALHPGGHGGTGAAGGGGGTAPGPGCPDFLGQTLKTFSVDIADTDWASIQNEFLAIGTMADVDFVEHKAVAYPIVFHYGAETVTDATIHLHGDSSWREAALYDGAQGKMQFGIAFDDVNSNATFHGVSKLKLDMPRTDPTFMRDRVAYTWLRSIGIPAPCATSAQLMVNGNLYGLFVAEEHFGHRTLGEFFPGNAGGDLFDAGETAVTNKSHPDYTKLDTFWDAMTPAALAGIVDLPGSLRSWAAEALLNDADGYWGGDHNFYLYDEGAKGYVFVPHDLDSSLDYLGRFDSDPITWWSVREDWELPIPQHYLTVIHDDALRAQYVEALRAQLGHYDVGQLQTAIDQAAGQVRAAVTADPHKPTDLAVADFDEAVALARRGIADRATYVESWLACWDSGTGPDGDGDGVIWCHDCRDDLESVHPGAAEVCGNHVDDDCNGVVDDGCP